MRSGAVLSPFLLERAYLRSMPTSLLLLALGWSGPALARPSAIHPGLPDLVDGLVTGAMMLAFYAFGEWAHCRQLALRRAKVVPFQVTPTRGPA
jgi:hypothetical protein